VIDEDDDRVRTLAFVMDQSVSRGGNPRRYLVSIDDVEAMTGLDFLAELPDDAEEKLEKRTAWRCW